MKDDESRLQERRDFVAFIDKVQGEILADIASSTKIISDTSRIVGLGLSSLLYYNISSANGSIIFSHYRILFVIASVCGLLIIVFDVLQNLFALWQNEAAEKLLDANIIKKTYIEAEKDRGIIKFYQRNIYFDFRNVCFYIKIVFLIVGSSVMCFVLLRSLLDSKSGL